MRSTYGLAWLFCRAMITGKLKRLAALHRRWRMTLEPRPLARRPRFDGCRVQALEWRGVEIRGKRRWPVRSGVERWDGLRIGKAHPFGAGAWKFPNLPELARKPVAPGIAVATRCMRLLATLLTALRPRKHGRCSIELQQCAEPADLSWREFTRPIDRDARTLAQAFLRWTRSEPYLADNYLHAECVKQMYEAATRDGWPPHRDFARELGRLTGRKRIWRQVGGRRTAVTIYPWGSVRLSKWRSDVPDLLEASPLQDDAALLAELRAIGDYADAVTPEQYVERFPSRLAGRWSAPRRLSGRRRRHA